MISILKTIIKKMLTTCKIDNSRRQMKTIRQADRLDITYAENFMFGFRSRCNTSKKIISEHSSMSV